MQQNVAGQILVFAAERIIDPGAKAWISTHVASRMHQQVRTRVQWKARDHGSDDRHLVRTAGQVRKQVADPDSRLPVLLELPRTLHPLAIGFLLGAPLVKAVE